MDLGTILEKYGWIAFVIVWTLREAFRFVATRYYPQKIREREEEGKAARDERQARDQAERESRAILLKSQIERDDREAERRLKLEDRMVVALEQMSLGITAGNERIAIANERLTAMFAAMTQHANFTFGAQVELKDRLDDLQDMLVQKQRVDKLEKGLSDTQEKIKAIRTEGKSE